MKHMKSLSTIMAHFEQEACVLIWHLGLRILSDGLCEFQRSMIDAKKFLGA